MPTTKPKRKRMSAKTLTGVLIANSKRKINELITVIYDPRTYNIIDKIEHPKSLTQ